MLNLEYYLSFYMFMFSCFMFSFYYKHLMLMVISLEFISIFLIYNMFTIIMNLMSMSYLMMMMMTFMVCEGALILTLVVVLIRFYGNDYINSLSMLKW